MLLETYTKEIFRPECNPSFQSLHCIAHLDEDIREALPYLNAVLGGFEYFKDPPAVTFRVQGKIIKVQLKMDHQGGRAMRNAWIITFVVIVLLFVYSPFVFSQDSGGKMILDEPDFNHGNVNEGEIIEHTFKVLNRGTAALEIIQVEPD